MPDPASAMPTDRSVPSTPNINLKLLQIFALVGEVGSFREAARRANRSQSAVSAQVRQLETQLGVELFRRTTRNVRLTQEGEQLLAHARRAVQEIDEGLRGLRESVEVRRGRVALACAPTVAGSQLAGILAVFERDYPGVHVQVFEQSAQAMFDSVRGELVDFAVGPAADSADFDFRHICDDPLYAVTPKQFSLSTSAATISLQAVARMPLLLLDHATGLRAIIEDALRTAGLQWQCRYQFTQVQTLIEMARAGLGCAILPKIALPDTRGAGLTALRIARPSLTRQLAICTLRGSELSPAAARLADLAQRMIAGAA